jgi:D-alanyl-D-alanine carboxypeptidase
LVAVAVGAAVGVWAVFSTDGPPPRPELQSILDGLVTGPTRVAPGVTAYVEGPHGTWSGAAGVANVETGERMKANARFRLESVSKAWTATIVLQLAASGRLGLDDTVARWLPGILPYGGRITVRELLNHTSGLIDNNDISADPDRYIEQVRDAKLKRELRRIKSSVDADPGFEFSTLVWVRFAAALPLLSTPGTKYHYSNIGYEVAGMIAERASGKSLARLYDEGIIEPLGLGSAAYDPQGDIAGAHALGYLVRANGAFVEATAWGTGGIGAEGGIVSDARDEARFLTSLMRGRLVGPSQLSALKTPPSGIGTTYALGLTVDSSGCAGTAYGHNGGGAGYATSVFVSGDGERVAVVLMNGNTHSDARAGQAVFSAMNRLYCAG